MSRFNIPRGSIPERPSSSNSLEEEQINEKEFEKYIEEFKSMLECNYKFSSATKNKIKPNISLDWLMDLKLRLKRNSMYECKILFVIISEGLRGREVRVDKLNGAEKSKQR